MIGLDTNVLVRFLVQDDVAQSRRANALMSRLSPGEPGYVTQVVLMETYWVLTGAYKLAAADVHQALTELIESDDIACQGVQEVKRALELSKGAADFPDALIAETCRGAGCSSVVSFDRRAKRPLGFVSP